MWQSMAATDIFKGESGLIIVMSIWQDQKGVQYINTVPAKIQMLQYTDQRNMQGNQYNKVINILVLCLLNINQKLRFDRLLKVEYKFSAELLMTAKGHWQSGLTETSSLQILVFLSTIRLIYRSLQSRREKASIIIVKSSFSYVTIPLNIFLCPSFMAQLGKQAVVVHNWNASLLQHDILSCFETEQG